MVFALNRVPPRYVSTPAGSVVTEVSLEKEQSRAAIDVAVMEGAPEDFAGAALRRTGSGAGLTLGWPR